jgi:hypothetical protein
MYCNRIALLKVSVACSGMDMVVSPDSGCVANFAQEAVKGQVPLSVEGLGGQGVEQCSRSAALVSGLHHQLSFLDHVHEFNTR